MNYALTEERRELGYEFFFFFLSDGRNMHSVTFMIDKNCMSKTRVVQKSQCAVG